MTVDEERIARELAQDMAEGLAAAVATNARLLGRWTRGDSPVRRVACPRCLAPAGEVCRTRTGRWLRPGYEHSTRFYLAFGDLLADTAAEAGLR